MPKKLQQSGFTMIELILVIVLLAIIGTTAAMILNEGLFSYITAKNVTDAEWQGRVGVDRMLRDIRAVRSSGDISTASASQFIFTDITGTSVTYQLTGSSLMRNSQVLADGVQSLTFTYTDKSGASTSTINAIRYVTFSVTVTQKGANYNVVSSVYLRDLV